MKLTIRSQLILFYLLYHYTTNIRQKLSHKPFIGQCTIDHNRSRKHGYLIKTAFSNTFKCFKQRAIIEFITHENESPTEIFNRLRNFYGEEIIDISNVCR